jgi:hypothetical protein
MVVMMWMGQNKDQRPTEGPDLAWDRQTTGDLVVEVAVDAEPAFAAVGIVVLVAAVDVAIGYDGGGSREGLLAGPCCTSN